MEGSDFGVGLRSEPSRPGCPYHFG
jgi:hypothetical protein